MTSPAEGLMATFLVKILLPEQDKKHTLDQNIL